MWTGAGLYARSDHRVADWRLHPLIHTLLEITLAQDIENCQEGGVEAGGVALMAGDVKAMADVLGIPMLL